MPGFYDNFSKEDKEKYNQELLKNSAGFADVNKRYTDLYYKTIRQNLGTFRISNIVSESGTNSYKDAFAPIINFSNKTNGGDGLDDLFVHRNGNPNDPVPVKEFVAEMLKQAGEQNIAQEDFENYVGAFMMHALATDEYTVSYRPCYFDSDGRFVRAGAEDKQYGFIVNSALQEKKVSLSEDFAKHPAPGNEPGEEKEPGTIDFMNIMIAEIGKPAEGFTEIISLNDKVKQNYQLIALNGRDPMESPTFVVSLHKQLKALEELVSKVSEKRGQAFGLEEDEARLEEAYKLNVQLCKEGIEKNRDELFDAFIRDSYAEINRIGKNGEFEPGKQGKDDKALEDQIAKAIYMSQLKYEWDHVHGTPEEIENWKKDILGELLSDSLEENIQKCKNSELYRNVMLRLPENRKNINEKTIKEAINTSAQNIADRFYQDIYPVFANGPQNDKDTEDLIKSIREIESIHGIAENLGAEAVKGSNLSALPQFDTNYMARRAKLYGEQKNPVNDKMKEFDKQEVFEDRLKLEREKAKQAVYNEVKLKKDDFKAVEPGINQYYNILPDLKKKYELYKVQKEALSEQLAAQERALAYKNNPKKIKPEGIEKNRFEGYSKEELKETVFQNTQNLEIINEEYNKAEYKYQQELKKYNNVYFLDDYKKKIEVDYPKFKKEVLDKTEQVAEEAANKAEEEFRNKEKDLAENKKNEAAIITNEALRYKEAEDRSDSDEMSRIRNARRNRDNEYKKEHASEYHKSYTDLNGHKTLSYISDSYLLSKQKMIVGLHNYSNKYLLGQQKEQLEFEKEVGDAIQANERIEKMRQDKLQIQRPQRDLKPLKTFESIAEPEFLLKDVVIDDSVHKTENELNIDRDPDAFEKTPEQYLETALLYAKRHEKAYKFWSGSQEYKDIVTELKDLKENYANKYAQNPEAYLSKCRKTIMSMDIYISRKMDEKDKRAFSGKPENQNSQKRREGMTGARANLSNALKALELGRGELGKDHSCEELKHELEITKNLAKIKKNPEIDDIIADLNNNNKPAALQKMENYLKKNVNKYKKENGYGFNAIDYRMDDEDVKSLEETGEYNDIIREINQLRPLIPANEDERLFKSILTGYENISQIYLKELSNKRDPEMERVKFILTTQDGDPNKSIDDVLGIRVRPDTYSISKSIYKVDSLDKYVDEFDQIYKNLTEEAKFSSVRMALDKNRPDYHPETALSSDAMNLLVESAFSKVFLKSIKNKPEYNPFDYDKVEQDRQKFMTILKKGSMMEPLKADIIKTWTMDNPEKVNQEMANLKSRIANTMGTPELLLNKLVPGAFEKGISSQINKMTELLAQNKPDEVKTSLESVTQDIRLAKALGMEKDVAGKANALVKEGPLKGNTLEDTVNNIRVAAKGKVLEGVKNPQMQGPKPQGPVLV